MEGERGRNLFLFFELLIWLLKREKAIKRINRDEAEDKVKAGLVR